MLAKASYMVTYLHVSSGHPSQYLIQQLKLRSVVIYDLTKYHKAAIVCEFYLYELCELLLYSGEFSLYQIWHFYSGILDAFSVCKHVSLLQLAQI